MEEFFASSFFAGLFCHASGAGEEAVRVVEALLIFTVAALCLSIVTGRIGTDELVANSQLSGGCLKEGFQVTPAVGEAIGELKTVIGLNTRHDNAFASKMLGDFA